jgi:pimeloyl-ACP methyl ester carboxylesterase
MPAAASALAVAAPVVLVHGVGFGPQTLTPLRRALDPHARVICVSRRGYGERAGVPAAATVAAHVEDIVATLDDVGIERAVFAGMSGGATVALALVLEHPERVVTAVAHEPAVGRMAPELRALVRAALGQGGGSELLRVLAGAETWHKLPADVVSALEANPGLVEADAAAFLAFEPPLASAGLRLPLVCSVGERSSALRFTVARRLAARTGAPVVVVPACGHLPQLDAPAAFAQLILDKALVNA